MMMTLLPSINTFGLQWASLLLILAPFLAQANMHIYGPNDKVINIDSSSFNKVLKSPHVVVAEFYAPWCGHCQKLAPEFKTAALKLNSMAKLVAINCDTDKNKALCSKYDVAGYPTIKIFSAGSPKGLPEDYNGERTSKGIIRAVMNKLPTTYVKKLGTGSGLIPVKSFMEDISLGLLMVVSDKKEIPYSLRAMALEFVGQLNVGFLNADDSYNRKTLNITKFPHVMLISRNGNPPATTQKQMKADEFEAWIRTNANLPKGKVGRKKYSSTPKSKSTGAFEQWVQDNADKPEHLRAPMPDVDGDYESKGSSRDPEDFDDDDDNDEVEDDKPKKKAKRTQGKKPEAKKAVKKEYNPIIPEIKNQTDLGSECLGKSGVCVVAFLPLEPNAPESVTEHEKSLAEIEIVKKRFFDKGEPFTFVWVNALERGKRLMRDFDVADTLPGLVAINSNKKVFRNFRGAFDSKDISRYLDDLYAGRGRNSKFVFTPALDFASARRADEL